MNQFRPHIYFIVFMILLGAVVVWTENDYGITWDEPLYYTAGDSYVSWITQLVSAPQHLPELTQTINQAWLPNAQHPPLVKILSGFAHQWTGHYRHAELVWYLLLIGIIYGIAFIEFGTAAAWFSALSVAFMPRIFADAHIVELDLPLTCLWVLTIYSYYRGIKSNRWAVATGVIFGLMLLTKVTAVFILIPLMIWGQIYYRKEYPKQVFSMLFLGGLVFIAGWPWLWQETFAKIVYFYEVFFTFKSPLKTMYFGQAYSSTPWHYPVLMSLLTTPLPVLIFSAYGIYQSRQSTHLSKLVLLVLFNILFFWILFASPGTLVIDGTRYFMPVFPLLGLLGGLGFQRFIEFLPRKFPYWKHYQTALLITLCIAPSIYWILQLHPAELSYFNLLIGGPKGAQASGMETTYWGEVITPETIQWMNTHLPQNANVKILPVYPGNAPISRLSFYPDVLVYYRAHGILRPDIQFFSEPPYDYYVLVSRQGLFDDMGWQLYRNGKPVYSLNRAGIQLMGIY